MNSYSTSWWSLLLINRSREDERLSWHCWLTYSGRLTHKVIIRPASSQAQDTESSPVKDQRSTTVLRRQLRSQKQNLSSACLMFVFKCTFITYCITGFPWLPLPTPDLHESHRFRRSEPEDPSPNPSPPAQRCRWVNVIYPTRLSFFCLDEPLSCDHNAWSGGLSTTLLRRR